MSLLFRVAAIVLVGFFLFGLLTHADALSETHHPMERGATHYACPLMGATSDCASALVHLSHWQGSFTGAFVSAILLVFFAVLYLVPHATRVWAAVLRAPAHRLRRHFDLPRHTLAEAFSSGLIHPKLY